MTQPDVFNLIWLRGPDCDGCSISAIGEAAHGGLERLLTQEGNGRLHLYHPLLAFEAGDEFIDHLRRAARGELDPFGLIVEASIPNDVGVAPGFYASLGEENGVAVPLSEWLDRLARRAAFVLAWGDCAVWGGPHSLRPNPTGATGVAMHLGLSYRSTLGLPVLQMPGCTPPPILIDVLVALLRYMRGEGPLFELDETNRPRTFYGERWAGALAIWQG